MFVASFGLQLGYNFLLLKNRVLLQILRHLSLIHIYKNKPVNIAKAAVEHAAKNGNQVVILDTAGRLHVDEDMMDELIEIKENVDVAQTILVVDAMTGQDAVNVAGTFDRCV